MALLEYSTRRVGRYLITKRKIHIILWEFTFYLGKMSIT